MTQWNKEQRYLLKYNGHKVCAVCRLTGSSSEAVFVQSGRKITLIITLLFRPRTLEIWKCISRLHLSDFDCQWESQSLIRLCSSSWAFWYFHFKHLIHFIQSRSSGLLREARCCLAAEAVQDRCLHSSVVWPPLEARAHRAGVHISGFRYIYSLYIYNLLFIYVL